MSTLSRRAFAVQKLVQDVLSRNTSGESYRAIAASFPKLDGRQIVKAGTLNRIVKTKGKYLPDDKEILTALGLRRERVLTPMQVKIGQMAAETRQALRWKVRKDG